MGNLVYKTKIYDGAGTTFLRNFDAHFPLVTTDVTYWLNNNSSISGNDLAVFMNSYNALGKMMVDYNTTFLTFDSTNQVTNLLPNAINLFSAFDGNIAVGKAINIVFNNFSYIKITCTSYSGSSTWYTGAFTIGYYLQGGTSIGSVSIDFNQNVYSSSTSLSWAGLPFCLMDALTGEYIEQLAFHTCRYYYGSLHPVSFATLYPNDPTYYYMSFATDNTFGAPGLIGTISMATFMNGVEPVDTDDPYIDIPNSQPSGPAEATGIPGNDPVDIPNLPTVAVSDTGFVTLFNPTLGQVKDLADYMWSGLFDVDTLRKLFANPMDCILGFNMLPVAIPNSGASTVKVGNISTGVSMNKATTQWVELDCGTLAVGDAFGNYLSYAPYTKFSMYLPYIGIVELSTDDVVGKTLALKYHIDVLSCACVAYLKCGSSVLYQFTGSCGYSIPINGNDFRSTISSVVSIAASIGGAVATGGLSAPAAVAVTASTVNNVMNSKPQIHRSGAIGSSAGILGIQKPFLIAEYPNPCKPKKQYHFTGYPSFVTVKLNDISGYAAFEEILIEGVPCTEEEQAMIKNLCKEGIFL